MGVKLLTLLSGASSLVSGQLSSGRDRLVHFGSMQYEGGLILYKAAHDYSGEILGILGTASAVSSSEDSVLQSMSYRYKDSDESLTASWPPRNTTETAVLPIRHIAGISRPAAAMMFSVIIVYCMFED
jgi:hypothetical protein